MNETIGGSERSLLGLNPWETPYELWARKVGLAPPRPPTWRMRVGQALEDQVAEAWCRDMGVRDLGKPDPVVKEWRRGSPDRLVQLGGEEAVLEVKVTRHWTGLPDPYFLQVLWYLDLLSLEKGIVAALDLSRDEIVTATVDYDADLAEEVRAEAEAFWRLVVTRTPPPPSSSKEAIQIALAKAKAKAGEIVATGEMEALATRLREVQAQIKSAEEEADRLKAALLEAMVSRGASKVHGKTWTAQVIERAGSIQYARLVRDLGVTEDVLERYRGERSRYLKVNFKEVQDE